MKFEACFPGFSGSRVSEELSELKSSCQKVQVSEIINFKKNEICKILMNLVQNFQQGWKMSIICMNRDLLGFFSLLISEVTSLEHLQINFC